MSAEGLARYQAFRRRVDEYRLQWPEQRLGQAMFNVLGEFDKAAEVAVYGTPLDPFFGTEVVNDFLLWLRARWDA